MTAEEFRRILDADANLSGSVHRAARAGKPPEQFGPLAEGATVSLMFPIVRYVLAEIGLPWLLEVKRWSELWGQKFHRWIDQQHREEGFDPEAAEAAGQALREELQRSCDPAARMSWERLREILSPTPYSAHSGPKHGDVESILRFVRRSDVISVPKLAAKTKLSTESVDTVLRELALEGLVTIKADRMGFDLVEKVEKFGLVVLGEER